MAPRREVPDLSFVARLTGENAVILSDQATSNGIAGLAGRKVVAPMNPDVFLVASGGWQRVLDVRRFLSRDATPDERAAIVQRWHVTHVLVDRLRSGAPGICPTRNWRSGRAIGCTTWHPDRPRSPKRAAGRRAAGENLSP